MPAVAHSPPPSSPELAPLPGMNELPYDFGENLESEAHRSNAELLTAALQLLFMLRPDIFVGGNMAIYFSSHQILTQDFRGPDVFVVTGTVPGERKSWVMWEETKGPDVVIELLSRATRHVDVGEKMTIYGQKLRVPWYFLFDPDTLEFQAWQLDPKSGLYVACPRDAKDHAACELLGLHIGLWTGTYNRVERTWLRWFHPDGSPVLVGAELAVMAAEHLKEEKVRAERERIRAEQERVRADEAQAKAEALRSRLRALGVDPDAP